MVSKYIFITALYNLFLATIVYFEKLQKLVGLNFHDQNLAKFVAGLLIYTVLTLIISSKNIIQFKNIILSEGACRILAAAYLVYFHFTSDIGSVVIPLACIDFIIGVSYFVILKGQKEPQA